MSTLPFPKPSQFYPVTQFPTSLCVSHSCFTKLARPCLPWDTKPFPLSSPLNKYALWSTSQNTLACTHAHSQSAALLDTGPDDSEGAVKVADGTPIHLTVTVQQTPEEEKQLRKKRRREKERLTWPLPCTMALMFGHSLFSVERCEVSICLKISILGLFDGNWLYRTTTSKLWTSDEKLEEREMKERGMGDGCVGQVVVEERVSEGMKGWGWDAMGQRVTHPFLMNSQWKAIWSQGTSTIA